MAAARRYYYLYDPIMWKAEIVKYNPNLKKTNEDGSEEHISTDEQVAHALGALYVGWPKKFDPNDPDNPCPCINCKGISELNMNGLAGMLNASRLYEINRSDTIDKNLGIWEILHPVKDIDGHAFDDGYYVRKIGEIFEIPGGK